MNHWVTRRVLFRVRLQARDNIDQLLLRLWKELCLAQGMGVSHELLEGFRLARDLPQPGVDLQPAIGQGHLDFGRHLRMRWRVAARVCAHEVVLSSLVLVVKVPRSNQSCQYNISSRVFHVSCVRSWIMREECLGKVYSLCAQHAEKMIPCKPSRAKA